MKINKYITLGAITMVLGMTACTGDLDVTPDDPNKTTELTTKGEWLGYFGSLYGNLIYEGNLTPSGVDGGAGIWSRCHWNIQELCTDEVALLNSWNDPGYPDLKTDTWTSGNTWAYMCFQREATSARQIVEFISKIDKAEEAGLTKAEIEGMKAEARVLHALCYYNMIDLFGKGPWVGEDLPFGDVPPTYDRKQLFDATTQELISVINSGDLKPAAQQEYGRVSLEAARMLLAKLYLNAEVYTGTPMYNECAAQCKEILKTVNQLAPTYKYLFCMSNDKYVACKENGGNQEIIWTLPQDEVKYQTYGGTTYLSAAAFFTSIPAEELQKLGNPNSIWQGLKVKPELIEAFAPGDTRYLFYAGDFNLGVEDLNSTEADGDGYMCVKYPLTDESDYDNVANKNHTIVFNSADMPMFRLGDLYLMLTECQLRGANGADPDFAYFNKVHTRAGLPAVSSVTLNDVLKERTCELYWEGHRRSDLIRFGLFTGGQYLWKWKGGVYDGTSIPEYRNLFAIPNQYSGTVGQNPGY